MGHCKKYDLLSDNVLDESLSDKIVYNVLISITSTVDFPIQCVVYYFPAVVQPN